MANTDALAVSKHGELLMWSTEAVAALVPLGFVPRCWDQGYSSAIGRDEGNLSVMIYQNGPNHPVAPLTLDEPVVAGFYRDGNSDDFDDTWEGTLREMLEAGILKPSQE